MEDSRKYEAAKYIVTAVGFLINTFFLIYLVASGWTFRIRDFAVGINAAPALVVLIYFAVIGVLFTLLQLPLDVVSGFYLEHRFGLSRQSLPSWIWDQVKGLMISAALGISAAEGVYALIRHFPDRWWLYAAIAFIAFFVLLTNLAPVVLLPLFFKFKPVENDELQRRVEKLRRQTNARIGGIFEWALGEKTRKANAAVVGWGNTRRIIVSDTLLENLSPEEIEVIMAHELCHHVKGHIWFGIGLQSALTVACFFIIDRVLHTFGGRFQGLADVANFPLLALTAIGVSVLVLPLVNGFSRFLERAADAYAIDITGDSLAFVSCMEKLGDLNLANKSPNPIVEFIFYSHPSIESRIKLAADRVGQIV